MSSGIVFINQATGYLTIDIVNKFAEEFDKVVLITGSVRIQETNLVPKVKVEYINKYNRGNNLKKAISWIIGTCRIFVILRFRYNSFDKFYVSVPPTAYLMATWFRGKYAILIYDLYPEALKVNGFIEKGPIYKWWSRRNSKIFGKAHKIYTLSEKMVSGILRYSPCSDVQIIPNWSAFLNPQPIRKEDNIILKRERLTGKFIVQYSGNIGVTHNVETLIEVADRLKTEKGIIFQIIGRGERFNEISRLVTEKKLTNCRLLPFRDDGELYESLCAADLAVIILNDSTQDISVPSKLYNLMAARLPVMAIASEKSGLAEIIAKHQIGRTFEKNNLHEMCDFILEMKNNYILRNDYLLNSREASLYYTRANANRYLSTFTE